MKQQWEYLKVVTTGMWENKWEGEAMELIDFLNKKGKEGWELVQGPSHLCNQCIFKRPL